MSNHLAIATVTVALQQLLQDKVGQEHPGLKITATRPTSADSNITGPSINLFLWAIEPNKARDGELKTRRPKSELIRHGQRGYDLCYLFTFYGNELELEPQRLAGSTLRALVDVPMLTPELLETSLEKTKIPQLVDSTLDEQLQSIRFLPEDLTHDELSRIWSMFGQVPYALSVPYRATAILIQGETAGQRALPVAQRVVHVAMGRPILREIEHFPPNNAKDQINTITSASTLLLHGESFTGQGETQVRMGNVQIPPQVVTHDTVEIDFAHLAPPLKEKLRAGSPGIQVVQVSQAQGRTFTVESGTLPFVLSPQVIRTRVAMPRRDPEDTVEPVLSAAIELDLRVEPGQRLFMLLNGSSEGNDETVIVRGKRLEQASAIVTFELGGVAAGVYFVRIQVDGAESLLHRDHRGLYSGPTIRIN